MRNLDHPQPSTDAAAAPMAQPTIVATERTLSDLSTGGWRRRLTGLPSTVGRPFARWFGRGRPAV